MYTRILVPLDGSDLAEQVLPFVSVLARMQNAKIVLLSIAEYPYEIYAIYNEYSVMDPELMETARNKEKAICKENEDYLKQVALNLQNDGMNVIAEVCEGPVVDTILDAIDRLNIDLITMCTCGSGGGSSWLVGAVAGRVLNEAQVPVILIRPERNLLRDKNPTVQHNAVKVNTKNEHENRVWTGTFSPAGTIFRY